MTARPRTIDMDLDSDTMLRVIAEATRTVRDELTDVPLPIEGALPAALNGVLFRNGPGRFERGGTRYGHPFDGDGHIVRLDIGAGGVRFRNRFVRTRELLAEERSGRLRYRAFGTNLPGGLPANLLRMRIKNAANTSVIWHGGRLLALWEGGPPHRLDLHTLATLGPESFDGRLRNPARGPLGWLARRLSPLLPFSAHPRLDADTGELINFGLVFGRPNRLLLYRVDRGGRMAEPETYDLPRFSFVHDLAVTRRWLCFLLPQADYDVPRALLGLKTPIGSLRIATERPMQALLIPRAGQRASARPLRFECVPGFVFHIAQAFDREDGALVLDLVRYREFPAFDDFESLYRERHPDMVPRLERLRLRPQEGRCDSEPWSERAFGLPVTAPAALGAPRRCIYGVGAPPERDVPYFTAIQRLNTETGEVRVHDFGLDLAGEPILVPGGDGSEGWLLCLVHRAGRERTDLVCLRASDLALQATATLPCVIPIGFHGCWVPRGELPAPGP
jgi:all-trans-8'-apo-beta-carotenal 15,15'-oxygenase